MSKQVLETVERLVNRLTPAEQLRIYYKVERATQHERLQTLLRRIRRRAAKHPISERRLKQLCDDVRHEVYEERATPRH